MIKTTVDPTAESEDRNNQVIEDPDGDSDFSEAFSGAHGHSDENVSDHSNVEEEFVFPSEQKCFSKLDEELKSKLDNDFEPKTNGGLKFELETQKHNEFKSQENSDLEFKKTQPAETNEKLEQELKILKTNESDEGSELIQPESPKEFKSQPDTEDEVIFVGKPNAKMKFLPESDEFNFLSEHEDESKFCPKPDDKLKIQTDSNEKFEFQAKSEESKFQSETQDELKSQAKLESDEKLKCQTDPLENLEIQAQPEEKLKFEPEPVEELKLQTYSNGQLHFQSLPEQESKLEQEFQEKLDKKFQSQQSDEELKFPTETDHELNILDDPDDELEFQTQLKFKQEVLVEESKVKHEVLTEFSIEPDDELKLLTETAPDEEFKFQSELTLKSEVQDESFQLDANLDEDAGLKPEAQPEQNTRIKILPNPIDKFIPVPDDEFKEPDEELNLQPKPDEEILESQIIEELVKPNVGPYLWPTLDEDWDGVDLCTQVLSAALNTLPADEHPVQEDVTDYLQKVFHTDDETHGRIFLAANDILLPKLILYVEVVEAKGLHGKDANGLSDPLCTLYVNPKQKINTSMKPETLAPSWEEHFSFPIPSINDVFNLTIWDYDPPESVAKKLKRIKEVKSAKGFKILMKDIVTTKSMKKQKEQSANDFMGSVKIPLQQVPSRGLEKWFPLEGKTENSISSATSANAAAAGTSRSPSVKKSNKGEILLRFKLGTDKDKMAAALVYRRAYHLMVLHELNEQNVEPNEWNGEFKNPLAQFVLHQLEWQAGLSSKQLDLAKWFAHTRIHSAHPLHASNFPWIFQNFVDVLDKELRSELEVQKFWAATEKLVENYAEGLERIHDIFLNNAKFLVQINYQLKVRQNWQKTLGLVKDHLSTNPIGGPESTSKFSAEFITEKLRNAILKGAHELYANTILTDTDSEETEIQNMMRIGKILNADLQAGLDSIQNFFKRFLGIDYLEITYRVYDTEFGQIVSPLIEDACKDLKRLDLLEAEGGSVEDDMSTGTTMYELYTTVRQFAEFSSHLTSQDDLLIAGGFHSWFYASVAQWLDMAFYKGVNRIKKAVELDTLQAVDKYVQRSSSAVDTAHVFHQIQEFWAKLAWPEIEGSYTFIAKILDELCRCNVLYSQNLFKKLEHVERKKGRGDKYEISDELCSAMNNIEYLGQEMLSLSASLGTEKILAGLVSLKGESIAAQCKRTLETVIENSEESINDKLYGLLVKLGEKVRPPIERLLKKAVENAKEEEGIQKLMTYMDDMLIKLKTRTSNGSFEKIFVVISETTSIALEELSRKSIEKKKHPDYFCRILTIHHVMIRFFHPDEGKAAQVKENNEQAKNLLALLETHAASTPELIMKYQQARHEYQNTLPPKPGEWGILTVRAQYCVDIRALNVEVLNARNLRATDSNGSSDPFVKVRVVPKPMYTTISRFRTKVMKETLFPLFDENFTMELTGDDMALAGFIQFVVYDHDVVGKNDFLGETFYPLASVPVTKSDTELKDIPQKNLVLHNPKDFDHPALKILESRKKDKLAFKFVKKEKSKTLPEPVEG